MKRAALPVALLALLGASGCQSSRMRLGGPAAVRARANAAEAGAIHAELKLHGVEREEEDLEEEEAREAAAREDFEKTRMTPEQLDKPMDGARMFDRGVKRTGLAESAVTNAPSNWRPLSSAYITNPNSGPVGGFVGGLAVNPKNSDIILAGIVAGIWRSADGGEKFVPVSRNQEYRDCRAIAFSPLDPRRVYAGCSTSAMSAHSLEGFGGFLTSTDGGGSWVKPGGGPGLPQGYPTNNTIKILVHPLVPSLVYAAIRQAIPAVYIDRTTPA
jgi:hypothetical protein